MAYEPKVKVDDEMYIVLDGERLNRLDSPFLFPQFAEAVAAKARLAALEEARGELMGLSRTDKTWPGLDLAVEHVNWMIEKDMKEPMKCDAES